MSLCRILNCQNCDTHVTQGHKCESCGEFGHGTNECGNEARINLLKTLSEYDRLSQDKFCTIPYCKYFWSHTTQYHYCRRCNNKGHSSINCELAINNNVVNMQNVLNNEVTVDCPICRTINRINGCQKKVFGLEETCKICLLNPVELYLPACGHTVMCMECAKSISN